MNYDDPRHNRARRRDPLERIKSRNVSKAASRAAWRLIDAHRTEYERLYAEELGNLRRVARSAA